jgi:hypothetical protein
VAHPDTDILQLHSVEKALIESKPLSMNNVSRSFHEFMNRFLENIKT